MSHVRLAQLMVNGRPVRRVPAKERLQAFKAGTGIYGGDERSRWALRRRRAGKRTLWMACVDDAEQLEPYVGADRAWKLASGWWFMDGCPEKEGDVSVMYEFVWSDMLPKRAHGPLQEYWARWHRYEDAYPSLKHLRTLRSGLSGKRWFAFIRKVDNLLPGIAEHERERSDADERKRRPLTLSDDLLERYALACRLNAPAVVREDIWRRYEASLRT